MQLTLTRWDFDQGQRGSLDRIPSAHTGPVMSLDWHTDTLSKTEGKFGDIHGTGGPGTGWVASGSMDKTVKVICGNSSIFKCYSWSRKIWDFNNLPTQTSASQVQKPVYTLNPSFSVRRVRWRPEHPCEIVLVSNAEFTSRSFDSLGLKKTPPSSDDDRMRKVKPSREGSENDHEVLMESPSTSIDDIEIWDVRRGWVAKSILVGSAKEGGTCDIAFSAVESAVLWAQHSSGVFVQHDLRNVTKPLNSIPRTALAWDGRGSMAFVGEKLDVPEIPFDDRPENALMNTPSTFMSAGSGDYFAQVRARQKYLGAPKYVPSAQMLGAVVIPQEVRWHDIFLELADTYLFTDDDGVKTCSHNQKVRIIVIAIIKN